jgi:hypothetical protein
MLYVMCLKFPQQETMNACGQFVPLLCHALLLCCATGTPIIPTELRKGWANTAIKSLYALLNNKGMCGGGDMAGGMIGPDCKPTKVSKSAQYKH